MGQLSTGKKTPGGAGTHTGHTRDTQAHKGTRAHGSHRQTSQPSKPSNTQPARLRDGRNRGQLNSRRPGADRSPRSTQKRPPPMSSRRERWRRACATAAAKPTWERSVEIMKLEGTETWRGPRSKVELSRTLDRPQQCPLNGEDVWPAKALRRRCARGLAQLWRRGLGSKTQREDDGTPRTSPGRRATSARADRACQHASDQSA